MSTKATKDRYINMSTPAALGIEVQTGESRFQIVMINGRPFLGMYRGDGWHPGDGWQTPSAIVNPDRFGRAPRTYAELLAYAQAFVAAAH